MRRKLDKIHLRINPRKCEMYLETNQQSATCRLQRHPCRARPRWLVLPRHPTPLAVNFAAVHSLQPSANPAGVHLGNLAHQMETTKVRMRMPVCHQVRWSFCPVVAETVGQRGTATLAAGRDAELVACASLMHE